MAIKLLNTNQGFDFLGKAKGSLSQQFKTLSMRTWVKKLNSLDTPAKLIHNCLERAYTAWVSTKKEKESKLRLASYFSGNFTLETCPTAYKKGKLYPKFWRDLPSFTVIDNHKEQSLIGGNVLLIYKKCNRWYVSQPCKYPKPKIKNTNNCRAIGLDPGLRNFLTGFDGQNWLQFTDKNDLEKLVKLDVYAEKLKKYLKKEKSLERKRKIKNKVGFLKRKLNNLKKELHRKVAVYLAKNYDIVFIPSFEVKRIFSKSSNNKKNNRTSRLLSHFEFRRKLAYYCAKYGTVMVTVNEAYSSKTCSKCGKVNNKLGSKKDFHCECGHKIDRDLNGSVLILFNSLRFSQGGLG